MDPLSVTLAIVSLATAIRDMVELAQKIHESFAKVSDNLQRAQHVAKDVKEMVMRINIFYEIHKEILDNTKGFCLALHDLLLKFRSFEASILPLLPQTGGRKRDRLIRGWNAWRNNDKIEKRILDLQSDIVNVMLTYMLKSTMRAEVKLEAIHQDTSRGLQALEVVRKDVSAIADIIIPPPWYEPSTTACDEFSNNVIRFATSTPSASAPMLRTPTVITEELMTTAYIKLQVDSMATTVKKMSMLPTRAANTVVKFRLSPILEQASMDITHLRRHIVRQVSLMRDLLENDGVHTISIQDSASALNKLSIGLETLGMHHESVLVGDWAVMLARALVDAAGGGTEWSDCSANLAHHLLNQSIQYGAIDRSRSLQAIEEAHTITQNLRNRHGVLKRAQFEILHSDILLQYARLVHKQTSIAMTMKAVQVVEDIITVRAFTLSEHGKIEGIIRPTSPFLDRLLSSVSPINAILSYARALRKLGTYLLIDGYSEDALNLVRLAIAIYRKMVSMHGYGYQVEYAWALLSVVKGGAAGRIPAEELINMADECIQLLRELATRNPPTYSRMLVSALWEKAITLGSLGRDVEAIGIWEEVASLAGQIIQDSKMCAQALFNLSNQLRQVKRLTDAVQTETLAISTYTQETQSKAWRYFCLSKDLQQLRRYKDSAEAAQRSVEVYRHLAMRDTRKWTCCLTASLSSWAHCLAAAGDYSEAFIVWKESVSLLNNDLLNANPDTSSTVITNHLIALQKYPLISHILADKEESLKISSTAVQYLRWLSETYPQETAIIPHLLWAESRHTSNLLRVGCLTDARQYIDHWIDFHGAKPTVVPASQIGVWYAGMTNQKANALDIQGGTEQALLATQRAHDIVIPFVSTGQLARREAFESMVQEARLRVSLGENEEALQIAERALRLAHDWNTKFDPAVINLAQALHAVAFTALSCGNYQRVIEAAREGVNICPREAHLDDWQNTKEQDMLIHPSLMAILSSAEASLGMYRTAAEYAHRAVEASLEIRDIRAYISVETADKSYMETRESLGNILLATGELDLAREICEERRSYFSKRIERRIGEHRELAPILRILGILYCSNGRHEEGHLAAQELSRIMKTLGSALPCLHEQVKIRLRNQVKMPVLMVLNGILQKLSCGHQKEVASLFAV